MARTLSLSLTSMRGGIEHVPLRSGLNWGQRPGRNSDQAYIAIPSTERENPFFPPAGIIFEVSTDDGCRIALVRAQQNGKALESKPSNALLGAYFRERLGVPNGHTIRFDHLQQYGRTTVDFVLLTGGGYILDFSSK